jgi:hypothetical protein
MVAMMPESTPVAMLVPVLATISVSLFLPADMIQSPGAQMSTRDPPLEN